MRIEDAVDLDIFPILGGCLPSRVICLFVCLFVCLFGYICLCQHHDFLFILFLFY